MVQVKAYCRKNRTKKYVGNRLTGSIPSGAARAPGSRRSGHKRSFPALKKKGKKRGVKKVPKTKRRKGVTTVRSNKPNRHVRFSDDFEA